MINMKTLTLNDQELDFITEILKEEMSSETLSNKEKYIIHDLIIKLQK